MFRDISGIIENMILLNEFHGGSKEAFLQETLKVNIHFSEVEQAQGRMKK